jgi:two-component system sensor histidine kinase RegB
VVAALRQALTPHEWARVDVDVPADESLVWPVTVVAKALGNIVRNALQASPEDGRVGLRARREAGGLIRIVVEDHGAGMSAEHLGRAGEPFFTTKPAGRGTGLGLFLARSSIEQLAGAVAISSTPGRGTTVIITLPADVVEMKAVHDS